MRAYGPDISPMLKQGLRPDSRVGRNSPYCTELVNVKVGDYGLEPIILPLNSLLPTGISVSWPFPQMILTSRGLILVTSTKKVYLIAGGYAGDIPAWNLQITLTGTLKGQLHCADFGGYIVAVSPNTDGVFPAAFVYRYKVADGTWEWADLGDGEMLYYTVCNFKQTLIYGKLDEVGWRPAGGLLPILSDPGTDESSGRSGESPTTVISGTRHSWLDESAGHVYVPHRDNVVLRVLPMESANGFIAYTSYGVYAYVNKSSPFPTFGRVDIAKLIGCAGWSCACSNDTGTRHIWITPHGELWTVDSKLEGKKLGYREYIQPMMAACYAGYDFYPALIITYSKRQESFFISNGLTTYMLSKRGLSQVTYHPTSFASWHDVADIHGGE